MRRLLPNTLFGQLWLSLSALLLASFMLSLWVFRGLIINPSAQHLGTLIADQVLLLAHQQGDASTQRLRGVRLVDKLPAATLAQADRYYLQSLSHALTTQLGTGTEIRLQRSPQPTLWVRPTAAQRWAGFDLARLEYGLSGFLLTWLLLISVLSLLGAYWLAQRFTQPLRQLALAAAALGNNRPLPSLKPGGTHELQLLQQAFNQTARDLAKFEADRALLLAGISHDLRTPLTRMRLALALLEAREEPLLDGLTADIGEMEQTINQFIDFVRGVAEEPAQTSDLNALITQLAARYAQAAVPPVLTLTSLPPLTLRPAAVRRLLANLLDNAYRHGQGEVQVTTTLQAGWVLLTVQDRGPGIPEAQQIAALKPYTRLDPARSTPGSGLGLAIVEKIVRLHGGQISLANRPGGGLCVQTRWPVAG